MDQNIVKMCGWTPGHINIHYYKCQFLELVAISFLQWKTSLGCIGSTHMCMCMYVKNALEGLAKG